MKEQRLMDLAAFRDEGYLQEVNRQFFHPLGLALALVTDDSGGGDAKLCVMDERHDAEGWRFVINNAQELRDLMTQRDKILAEVDLRAPTRTKALGYWVQPLEYFSDRKFGMVPCVRCGQPVQPGSFLEDCPGCGTRDAAY